MLGPELGKIKQRNYVTSASPIKLLPGRLKGKKKVKILPE